MQENSGRKPFFTKAAEEGNRCVVCKSVHVGVSTGMLAFVTHHTVKTWRRTILGNRIFNLGAALFCLGLGGFHGKELVGLWKDLREEGETVPHFAWRQTKIFLLRHRIIKN